MIQGASPKEAPDMTNRLYRDLALALIGGIAFVSAPAFASDESGKGALISAPGLIGPGVSELSTADVNFGSMDAGVIVAPDVAFGLPVVATIPDQGWAPIEPVTGIDPNAY
jgi:hypothetical protein